jgi:hypothetical protein
MNRVAATVQLDAVQLDTVDHVASDYTCCMVSENSKTMLYAGWAIAVGLAAVAIGITSGVNWMVVASVAVVPPLVARRFWHAPEQTISESIQHARR